MLSKRQVQILHTSFAAQVISLASQKDKIASNKNYKAINTIFNENKDVEIPVETFNADQRDFLVAMTTADIAFLRRMQQKVDVKPEAISEFEELLLVLQHDSSRN